MVRQVALLRGINNAGTGTRVAMADLRALFEGLGFCDVRTLLNSGNVVFSVPAKGRGDVLARTQQALAAKLQVTSPVAVLSADEVAAVVHNNPLAHVATNPSRLLVVVPLVPSGLRRLLPLLNRRRWLWAVASLISGAPTGSRRVASGWQWTARWNIRAQHET